MEERPPEDRLKDLPLQTENIHFKLEEMIDCVKCRRLNPPNRSKCLYCGGELEISESQSQHFKPNLRKLENWEKGFNIIFRSIIESADRPKLDEIAGLLKSDKAILEKIIEAGKSLPLTRAETEKEAEIVRVRLREFGVETFILSDDALAVEKPPKRLRGIEFFGDKLLLILFNRDEVIEISPEDLTLIVTGAVFERKIAATEEYSKKGEGKILETTETASDEILLDIYDCRDAFGYRIFAGSFDFSSLEAEKELLARDNIKKLVAKLRRIAPHARYEKDYLASRGFLAAVWEVEQKTDSHGLKREGYGKFNVGKLTTVNNLLQFTKYSRLQRHLL